jgi:hypothetical protein
MKRLLTVFLLSLSLYASTTLTVTGPLTVVAGQPAILTISLAGSAGQNMVAVQWTIAPPAGASIGTPMAGAAVTAVATDSLYSNPANGTMLVVGTAAPVALADGVLATIPVTFTAIGTISLPLTGIFAATQVGGAGVSLNGVVSGPTFSIRVTSPCAVTGDASVSVADIQAVINASLGLTPCSFPGFAQCTVVQTVDVEIAANGGACIIH